MKILERIWKEKVNGVGNLVSIMMVLKVSCFRELLGFAKFEEHEKSDSFEALECGFRSSEKACHHVIPTVVIDGWWDKIAPVSILLKKISNKLISVVQVPVFDLNLWTSPDVLHRAPQCRTSLRRPVFFFSWASVRVASRKEYRISLGHIWHQIVFFMSMSDDKLLQR